MTSHFSTLVNKKEQEKTRNSAAKYFKRKEIKSFPFLLKRLGYNIGTL